MYGQKDRRDMGVLGIKGAFLLAPRRREQECLMMTIPPKLLVSGWDLSAGRAVGDPKGDVQLGDQSGRLK